MKSIFNATDRAAILKRIDSLTQAHKPLWGTMSVAQMARHCALCEEYYYGKIKVGRSLIGRLFGRSAIKGILKDDKATLQKNAPTASPFKVTAPITDLEPEKRRWKVLVAEYAFFEQEEFVHWFFGRLSKQELGQFIYKHCDHHLRQFGVDEDLGE